MDSREYLVPETEWNEQIFIPILKQEVENDIDEEYSHNSDCNMYPSEQLELSKYVNYYDSKTHVLEQAKKEFSDDEYPPADCRLTVQSKIVSEDISLANSIEERVIKEGPLNIIEKEIVENGNTEKILSSNIKQENEDEMYEIKFKIDTLDEKEMLDNTENISIHYDDLVSAREVQCKLCGRIFNNRFHLLKHNNEHIKIKINTPVYNGMKELLYRCQYCDAHYNSLEDMLGHLSDVHGTENVKCELCGDQFIDVQSLKCHILELHNLKFSKGLTLKNAKCKYCNIHFKSKHIYNSHMKLCHSDKANKKIKYKCDTCGGLYKTKKSLTAHVRRIHYDFGRTFECWCGERFRTPIHLSEHKNLQHTSKKKNNVYKCMDCDTVFNSKSCLNVHMQRIHCDYGRVFECWCGKEFRTPIHLREHKSRLHNCKSKDEYYKVYRCDYCKRLFKSKRILVKHIRSIHYDYGGRVFECECGLQFRTPIHLACHKVRQHNPQSDSMYNIKVQCDSCQRTFKNKINLVRHIRRIHYDYGKVFECWCGKVFRSPYHLNDHKSMRHDGHTVGTLTSKFQCDICQKLFESNHYLKIHRKRMHYSYDRLFESQ